MDEKSQIKQDMLYFEERKRGRASGVIKDIKVGAPRPSEKHGETQTTEKKTKQF
jgi:hypothetical protein